MTRDRWAVIGGVFNPLHLGHLRLAEVIREEFGFDVVLFVPAFDPPHKQWSDIAPFHIRCEMVRLSIAPNKHFKMSTAEYYLPKPSHTIRTLEELVKSHEDVDMTFVTGIESWFDLPNWDRYQEILGVMNWLFVSDDEHETRRHFSDGSRKLLNKQAGNLRSTSMRDYFWQKTGTTVSFRTLRTPKIRATEVRHLLDSNRSVRYMVPDPVVDLIKRHRLYRKSTTAD